MRNNLSFNNLFYLDLLKPFLLSLQFCFLILMYFFYNTSFYIVFEFIIFYFFNYFFFRFIFILVNKKNDIYFAIFFLMVSIFGYFGYFGLIPLEDIWLMSCFLVLASLIWFILFNYVQDGSYLIINDVFIYQVSFYSFFRKYKIGIHKLYIINYFSFYLIYNSVLLLNKFFNIYLLNVSNLFTKSNNFNNYLVIYQYLYINYSEKLFLKNQLKLELYKYNKLFLQNLNNNLFLLDLQNLKFLNQNFLILNDNCLNLKSLNYDLFHNLNISFLNNNNFFVFLNYLNNVFNKLIDLSSDLEIYNNLYKSLILKIQNKLFFDENLLILLNFFDILSQKLSLSNILNIRLINFIKLITNLINEKLNTFYNIVDFNEILLLNNDNIYNEVVLIDFLNEDVVSVENSFDYFEFNKDDTDFNLEDLEDVQDLCIDINNSCEFTENSEEFVDNFNELTIDLDYSLFFSNTKLFNYNNGLINLDYFFDFYLSKGYLLIFKYLLIINDNENLNDLLIYILYNYIFSFDNKNND